MLYNEHQTLLTSKVAWNLPGPLIEYEDVYEKYKCKYSVCTETYYLAKWVLAL